MDELSDLNKLAKKVVNKQAFKKISSIKDKEEKKSATKYALFSHLERKSDHLEIQINQAKKDVLFALLKHKPLNAKIDYFKASLDEEDLDNVLKIIQEVENELKDV